ncbi:hypothetical protein PUNSTDRAFT_101047 [Punctularia strigosozonata HHB-11173 SS5]|uniref:uncharacterized protein n=1 Tax=Punctularia strigosozonata (strain HHB-11173) TaxID=741275 RepID=UPI0004416416|nr:uncharacterized protein PUNSTDRAFT_101047 [Punctularia strigosozonata HHB-11173 SS5]EIN11058.1 hypothetical protein PUNSTDRAFT_101047 [Punctularia strigosozonata HHB-11173 SS5]
MKKAGKKPDELAEPKPNEAEINSAWKEAESVGMQILESRSTTAPTKNHRRALANALSLPPFPDTMALLLSGILTAYSRPEMFNLMLHLELVSQPYRSPIHFQSHLSSYKTMLALLPRALLPFVTPRNFRAIASRDVHNSFGIWSHPGDSTAEMLGFGIWPDASFFNHSCAPNMGTKDRLGRAWEFRSSKQIQKDEELFISYLSLEELEEMDAFARRERLQNVWGFECSCHRCRIEIEGNES